LGQERIQEFIEAPALEATRMSGIKVQRFQHTAGMDSGLMIIELRKYNSAENYL